MADFLQNGRAELVPLDFFAGTPVRDCDFYYVRASSFLYHRRSLALCTGTPLVEAYFARLARCRLCQDPDEHSNSNR